MSGARGSLLGRGNSECKGPEQVTGLPALLENRRAGRPVRLAPSEPEGEWGEVRSERQCRATQSRAECLAVKTGTCRDQSACSPINIGWVGISNAKCHCIKGKLPLTINFAVFTEREHRIIFKFFCFNY